MAPETLMEEIEEREEAAAALERLLGTGRLLLTRKKKLALPEQTGLVYGRVQGNARGFGFFIPEDGRPDMFLPADAMHGAMHGDSVWVRQTDQVSRNGSPEAEVVLIALRAQSRIIGTLESDTQDGYVVPDDVRLYMDVLVLQDDMGSAKNGDKVVIEITQYPDGRRPLRGKVTEVLGGRDDKGTDMLAIIRRMELPDEFSKAELRQARALNKPVDEEMIVRREDLRGWCIITIDGADAKDLDDAVSLVRLPGGNFLLGVHIADVSAYIGEGSLLDKEAYRRGTSVYFPDRVLPMFPEPISNGVCSLNEGQDKLTLSCIMELDGQGKVVAHRFSETIIKSVHRMCYEDVNAMFAENEALVEKYQDIWPMLQQMRELQELLYQKRMRRGSLDFDLDEAKIELDKMGHAVDVRIDERGIANRMIEEFMLVANETVAAHVGNMGLPMLYRVHETPDSEKLQNLNIFLGTLGYGIKNMGNVKPLTLQKILHKSRGTPEENVVNRVLLRSLKKARYSEQCLGHFGLAAEYYCHFTSPIRRYPDLTVHRIVKEILHGSMNVKRVAHWQGSLAETAKHSSDRELAAMEAEHAAEALKKAEYMHQRLGAVETGIISGVTQFGFFVRLRNTVEGLVRIASIEDDFYTCEEKNFRLIGKASKRVFRLGDEVRIQVSAVDMESTNIDFVLCQGENGKTTGHKNAKGNGNKAQQEHGKGNPKVHRNTRSRAKRKAGVIEKKEPS